MVIQYMLDTFNLKDMENLVGQIVEVIVSKNGKVASKNLKVCKVNSRSI